MARTTNGIVGEEKLMTDEEAARYLHVTKQRLARWRCQEIGPPYIKMGKTVLYRLASLEEYARKREVKPAYASRVA